MARLRILRQTAILVAGLAASASFVAFAADTAQGGPALYGFRIVNTYPHDSAAFTQGLVYRDGFLYESTGQQGQSSLRKVRLETGEVVQKVPVDTKYFAEGLADYDNRLIQLTWTTQVGFVYDLKTFARQSTFTYSGEGWGLARDRARLIMSDGTSRLRFLNPATLRETGAVMVRDAGRPVERLNELEVVGETLLANIWQTDRICRINPVSGQVTGWIDLTGLLSTSDRRGADVLNGIAYDAAGDRLFVTGKYWPKLFEIKLERRQR